MRALVIVVLAAALAVTGCAAVSIGEGAGGYSVPQPPGSAGWPQSSTGRPTLYYFGTPT